MSEAVQTLDGWYCFMISAKWTGLFGKSYPSPKDKLRFRNLMKYWNNGRKSRRKKRQPCFYSIVGQKADLMLMILRPTMEELNEIENELNKTLLAEYLLPSYSFVSVVELSSY